MKVQQVLNKYKEKNIELYNKLKKIKDNSEFILSVFLGLKKKAEQDKLLEFIEKNKDDMKSNYISLYVTIKHRKLDIDTNDINNIKELLK